MFWRVLEQVIKSFIALITKKPHFLPKNCQKMIFGPKTVFLVPKWLVVGAHTLL